MPMNLINIYTNSDGLVTAQGEGYTARLSLATRLGKIRYENGQIEPVSDDFIQVCLEKVCEEGKPIPGTQVIYGPDYVPFGASKTLRDYVDGVVQAFSENPYYNHPRFKIDPVGTVKYLVDSFAYGLRYYPLVYVQREMSGWYSKLIVRPALQAGRAIPVDGKEFVGWIIHSLNRYHPLCSN